MRRLSRIEIAALSQAQRAQLTVYGARWDALRRARPRPPIVRALRSRCATPTRPADCLHRPKSCGCGARRISPPAWAKRRHAAGDNVRALVVDAVRRKTETGRRPRHFPVGAHGLGERAGTVARGRILHQHRRGRAALGEKAQPALRMRLADFFQRRRRRRLSFAASGFSLMSAPWLGTMQYLHDVAGLQTPYRDPRRPVGVARNASWIVPHAHVCWLMEKPQLIRHDANGRLHAPDGPALLYGDGSQGLRLERHSHSRAHLIEAAKWHRRAQHRSARTIRKSGAA